MTKMASYEAAEGKKYMAVTQYFRSDYVTIHVIKAVITATVAFGIGLALFIFYDFETFMQDVYKMDLIFFARNVLICYGATVAVYGSIAYGICSYRYAKAKKSLKQYLHHLKKLNTLYRD